MCGRPVRMTKRAVRLRREKKDVVRIVGILFRGFQLFLVLALVTSNEDLDRREQYEMKSVLICDFLHVLPAAFNSLKLLHTTSGRKGTGQEIFMGFEDRG